jgi:hypothetical protein
MEWCAGKIQVLALDISYIRLFMGCEAFHGPGSEILGFPGPGANDSCR